MDPKVVALRNFWLLLRVDVAAGDMTQPQALAALHAHCDRLWPPARLFNGRLASP